MALTSGDLARRTGNTVRTVRFYEEAGLLRPSAKASGGRRWYAESDVVRLEVISDLRELGLPLEDIRELLDVKRMCRTPRELSLRLSDLLEAQLERATRRMAALNRLKEELRVSLTRLGGCEACTSNLATDACPACDVVSAQKTPRLIQVVLGRKKPCAQLQPVRARAE
jgi:DNA-binding transcriptional MerR regulator